MSEIPPSPKKPEHFSSDEKLSQDQTLDYAQTKKPEIENDEKLSQVPTLDFSQSNNPKTVGDEVLSQAPTLDFSEDKKISSDPTIPLGTTLTGEKEDNDQTLIEDNLDVTLIPSYTNSNDGLPSNLLGTKYQEMQEIARGGMGKIVLWKDLHVGRVVATKLSLLPSASTEKLQRFCEEGQITGQLQHPNIVPIYEMGVDKEYNPYFTMKYVQGESLKKLIERLAQDSNKAKENFSLGELLEIFKNICYALSYAHSQNVVHRDLKPDNIMLGKFGEVMVMDWGLAKVLGQGEEVITENSVETLRSSGGFQTLDGRIAGTPAYMSPEQAAGNVNEIDQRSDIYALGTILFEMLTGEKCVSGHQVLQIVANVSEGKRKTLPNQGIFGRIDREIRAIVDKALAFNKEDRYSCVHDMTQDIQAYLSNKEVSVCHYNIIHRLTRQVKKYRREITLFAASMLIFWLALYSFNQQKAANISQQAEADFYKLKEQTVSKVETTEDVYKKVQQKEKAKRQFLQRKDQMFDIIKRYEDAYELRPNYQYKKQQAQVWLQIHEEAFQVKDNSWRQLAIKNIKQLLNPIDFAEYQKLLEGKVPVTLIPEESATEVYLYRFREGGNWFRLFATPYNHKTGESTFPEKASFGQRSPLFEDDKVAYVGKGKQSLMLPEGSYLVVWKNSQNFSFRSLFLVRPKHYRNKETLTIRSQVPPKIPEGFIYIPESVLWSGGSTVGSYGKNWRKIKSFAIQKQEVTFAQYLLFLESLILEEKNLFDVLRELCNEKRKQSTPAAYKAFVTSLIDQIAKGKAAQAKPNLEKFFFEGKKLGYKGKNLAILEKLVTTELCPKTFKWPVVTIDAKEKQVSIHPKWRDIKGWKKHPVFGVSKLACELYCLWQSQTQQQHFRLPKEWEWELAARGVDGRTYSWGKIFWKNAALLNSGYGGGSSSILQQQASADVSPWEVENLGGSLGEWTSTPYSEKKERFVIRGNIWGLTPEGLKCAFRVGESPQYFHPTLGFRLVLNLD